MLDVTREDITEGPLARALVLVSIPLVAESLARILEQLVDTFWVGRLGDAAVAAVGLNFPINGILVALVFQAPFVGTQVLVSQRYGGDDPSAARVATFHAVTLGVLAGTVVGAAAFVGARPLLALFDPGQEVVELGAIYLSILALRLPVSAAVGAIEAAFVGWGDSRAALYLNLLPVGVNFVLDPVLIFGFGSIPALGIAGAALATVLSTVSGLALALVLMFGPRDSFSLTRESAAFDLDEYRELLDVGLPATGQMFASQSVRVAIVAIVSAVGGEAGLAAYNVGGRIATLAFVPAGGIKSAARTVVGQNLGADRPDRAYRATWLGVAIAGTGTMVIGVLQWLFPGAIATVIVPGVSPEALALTVDYLEILAVGYWGIGAGYLFLGGFDGARRTRVSMVADLLKYWAVRLPIAAAGALVLDVGVHAVFWAVTLSNVVAAVGLGVYYVYSTRDGMLERAAEVATAD